MIERVSRSGPTKRLQPTDRDVASSTPRLRELRPVAEGQLVSQSQQQQRLTT